MKGLIVVFAILIVAQLADLENVGNERRVK